MMRARLGVLMGKPSIGLWDMAVGTPDDVVLVALFLRSDTDWEEMREAFEDEFECHDIDPTDDLTPLRLDGLTTFADERLVVAAELATRCHLRFNTVPCAAALADKSRQRQLLSGSRVGLRHRRVASRVSAAAAVAELDVPCLLKPISGWASRGIVRLHPGADLPGTLCLPAVVEEEVVHGQHPRHGFLADYFSVESVVVDGRPTHLAFTGRLPVAAPFRESGAVQPAALPADIEQAALDAVECAFSLLGVSQGTFHSELKLTPDGRIVVIEINGRLGGFVDQLARMTTGESLLERSIQAALGRPVDPLPGAKSAAAVMFVHPADQPVVQRGSIPVQELRDAVPEIVSVQVRTEPGAVIDPAGGTDGAVAYVWLQSPTVAALASPAGRVVEKIRRIGFDPLPVNEGNSDSVDTE